MTRSAALIPLLLLAGVSTAQPRDDAVAKATGYLEQIMDQFHRTYDVYTDVDAAGNHFAVRARMSNYDNTCRSADAARTVPPMNEAWPGGRTPGSTCIRASFRPEVKDGEFNWGAWYFMNGIQRDPDAVRGSRFERCPGIVRPTRRRRGAVPEPNWGNEPDAGVDLTGAVRLTLWVRGEQGGERVEFFALGVGWNADEFDRRTGRPILQHDPQTDQAFAHPDSSPKTSTCRITPARRSCYLTLLQDWQPFTIELAGKDLSYVLGGFGWASSAIENPRTKEVVFYMDDIRYELDPQRTAARKNQPRFPVSYQAGTANDFDRVMRNAAYTYDSALALLAFLAAGEPDRAKLIADAFVQAQASDRFYPPDARRKAMYDGSVRNAYQAGDLTVPAGWTAGGRPYTARMPGWYFRGDPTAEGNAGADVRNATAFARAMLERSDPLTTSLCARMAPGFLEMLARGPVCARDGDPDRRDFMAGELNRVIASEAERRALEAAYPNEIERLEEGWLEDAYWASLDTGNIAWTMLALLAYHDNVAGGRESLYLSAAVKLGEWVVRNCDAGDGYTGGYSGFEPDPERAYYKSTEHNIDLYAAFKQLQLITGDPIWETRASQACGFVMSMWDDERGMFWTGTTPTGETNREVIPLDIQAWAVLSLRDELPPADRVRALDYVERHMRLERGSGDRGYDYSRRACDSDGVACRDTEGVWYEGTAQMAAAYRVAGDSRKSGEILALLRTAQLEDGAMPASNREQGLATGFRNNDHCIRYFSRAHVGATAWFVLAGKGVNPYWMGVRPRSHLSEAK